ncbi:glutamate receptor ionotropic, kainate 2-like [Panulirus ornatus]|uniref:glutamate receptor ionotropic, kainate 2-like n=1 Tax=Panulirus ornatus TaxID=150431 RepID=UPI003A83F5CC
MRKVSLKTTLLYGWGALLEQPHFEPSVSSSGQVLVGWWLVFCLIISTGFKSSLIAHLTVQGKSRPIDTLEDLVEQVNWMWGCEAWLLKGVPLEYFSRHTDPVVKKIYKEMEVLDGRDALYKVLAGGYSFISFKNYISVIVASQHSDERGYIPFHISNKGIHILAAFGWGFRWV